MTPQLKRLKEAIKKVNKHKFFCWKCRKYVFLKEGYRCAECSVEVK